MLKSYGDGPDFRVRAQECWTKAELLYDVRMREKMLKLAANYERMADRADELSSTDLPAETATK
jgi:hypothetical protein